MSDNKIAEIRERHARDAEWSGGWAQICPRTHADRATLLAEVERLIRERDEARADVDRLRGDREKMLLDERDFVRKHRAEIERLIRERDEARSKETDYREGFEEGWDAAQRGAAAVVERMREALIEWDALIQHQYSGSREAMTDMQYAALRTKRILDELDAPKALEAKP